MSLAVLDGARNPVMVVSHPDDEVMWGGGLLARYGERFTVICCSIPRADPERAYCFFDACEQLGAKARLLPFVEKPPAGLERLDLLDLEAFDLVVTHNAQGEYGHVHHRQLHRQVKDRWPDKVATFGWTPAGSQGDAVLYLTADEQARRMRALQRQRLRLHSVLDCGCGLGKPDRLRARDPARAALRQVWRHLGDRELIAALSLRQKLQGPGSSPGPFL